MGLFGRSHKKVLEQANKDFAKGSYEKVNADLYKIVTDQPSSDPGIYIEMCETYLKNIMAWRVSEGRLGNADSFKTHAVDLIEKLKWNVSPKVLADTYAFLGKAYFHVASSYLESSPKEGGEANKGFKNAKKYFKKANAADSTNADAAKYTNPHKEAVKLIKESHKVGKDIKKLVEARKLLMYEFVSADEPVDTSPLGYVMVELETTTEKALNTKFSQLIKEATYQQVLDSRSAFSEMLSNSTTISADSNKGVDVPSANSSKAGTPEKGTPDHSNHSSPDKGYSVVSKNPMIHDHHHEVTVGGQDSYHSDYGHN